MFGEHVNFIIHSFLPMTSIWTLNGILIMHWGLFAMYSHIGKMSNFLFQGRYFWNGRWYWHIGLLDSSCPKLASFSSLLTKELVGSLGFNGLCLLCIAGSFEPLLQGWLGGDGGSTVVLVVTLLYVVQLVHLVHSAQLVVNSAWLLMLVLEYHWYLCLNWHSLELSPPCLEQRWQQDHHHAQVASHTQWHLMTPWTCDKRGSRHCMPYSLGQNCTILPRLSRNQVSHTSTCGLEHGTGNQIFARLRHQVYGCRTPCRGWSVPRLEWDSDCGCSSHRGEPVARNH